MKWTAAGGRMRRSTPLLVITFLAFTPFLFATGRPAASHASARSGSSRSHSPRAAKVPKSKSGLRELRPRFERQNQTERIGKARVSAKPAVPLNRQDNGRLQGLCDRPRKAACVRRGRCAKQYAVADHGRSKSQR
jgi:hypothetical protein